MLRLPSRKNLEEWVKEVVDECMTTSEERGMVYSRATMYYYQGTWDARAAIHNKCKGFVDKLAGFLMQPSDVRFAILYDSDQDDSVLERAQLVSEKLSADYTNNDADVGFAEAVVWSLVNGAYFLKHLPTDDDHSFMVAPVHPQNIGVLSETTSAIDEQEAFVHVTYPTMSRLRTMLADHPRYDRIMAEVDANAPTEKDADRPNYFHQMVVGGLTPLGDVPGGPPKSEAAGIVNVFPAPTPWAPNRRLVPTVKHCELWIRDRDRDGDWTTLQCVYGHNPVIIEGDNTRRNLSRMPGHQPFVKIQAQQTPGYFWGRSIIADVQMLQDLLNKRLRDLKVMWDRNVNAPQVFSGFTSITEEQYYKIISEGGFLNDPNPNAKASKLVDPPPQNYLEELQFIFQLFDEAGGFTPIMSGQGESGVRAGVHAQTLVRTSSPRLIDQAARIERQLAESGDKALRIMQAMDAHIYTTADSKIEFLLSQMPEDYQVQVDSHSASPAFAEDNRQLAIALARAGAVDAEDLVHMLHPPGAALLLARLRKRQKAQAQAAQMQEAKQDIKDAMGLGGGGGSKSGGGGGRKKR